MSVFDTNGLLFKKLDDIRDDIRSLNLKVDKLLPRSSSDFKEEINGTFVLRNKDNLVWWTKVDTAARYRLVLNINLDEVASIDLDRETRFYVFDKMPKGISYTVKVIAENREGKEIVSVSIGL